jgi:hypothetical protein
VDTAVHELLYPCVMTRRATLRWALTCATLLAAGCEGQLVNHDHLEESGDVSLSPDEVSSLTVGTAVGRSCTTAIVRGLSEQLIDEINCLRPGTMRSIQGIPGVSLGGAVMPYLQTAAADGLRRAASRAGGVSVNSAIRTLAQQYLLYRWYRSGSCGIGLAASPGNSNHETGIAVDVNNPYGVMSGFNNSGWSWLGRRDEVHFDYVGGGTTSLRGLSVQAFQRLWNRNNPGDRIPEDGDYGPATESRLARAPASGFTRGASCGGEGGGGGGGGGTMDPAPATVPSFAASWERKPDGAYAFRATPPASVRRVEFRVDGIAIATAERGADGQASASYTFRFDGPSRPLVVRGLDAAGAEVARAVGMLDVTEGTGVFVRPLGDRTYEIGLERADSAIGAIEVKADGFALTDAVSGAVRSPRMVVRYRFNEVGERNLAIDTLNAGGSYRGTLRRTLTLR